MKNQCEDAYFILDRAFGVSDGVSGWNDYGFSSDQFSLQLMSFSQKGIEHYIKNIMAGKGKKQKKKGMKRSQSFLSMDNLDISEDDDEDQGSNSGSDDKSSSASIFDSDLELQPDQSDANSPAGLSASPKKTN